MTTSLTTEWTAYGGTTCHLAGFGLVGTITYNGHNGHNFEPAEGEPKRVARYRLGNTCDVTKETADWMALVIACEIAPTLPREGED